MRSRRCLIVNKKGLHARAAAEVVQLSQKFQSTIKIGHKDDFVPATSLMHLLTLAAYEGCNIEIQTEGEDEEQALEELSELVNKGFYET